MGIKFLEIDSTETNEFGVFRNDYTESLEKQMTKSSDGFYHSHSLQPILLNHFKRKKKRLVRGYDIGNNNILGKEQKIIEFAQYLDQEKDILHIAFTYMNDDIHICMSQTECNVYLYSIDLKDKRFSNALEDKSQNIFDLVVPIQITEQELNRKLSFNKANYSLTWERICNHSTPNEKIKTITYDIYNHKIINEQESHPIYERHIEIKIEKALSHSEIKVHYEKIEGVVDFYVIVVEPRKKSVKKHPAITICLGGPQIPIPDFCADNSIYKHFINKGYYLICPLRRGVVGISHEWEHSIDGKCGTNEIEDIIYGTDWILKKYINEIDEHKVGLYGASYGGFSSFLIAGKYNINQRFKAFVSHCGIFNLESYLNESYGGEKNIISGFIGSENKEKYLKDIKDFSPHYFIEKWNAPMLIVHAIDDNSAWFGQSVEAYNVALNYNKDIELLLNPGPHTYNTDDIEIIFNHITDYFSNKLSF